MLSPFRKKKFSKLFHVFDANQNGHLDMNDVTLITQQFAMEFGWPLGGAMDNRFKAAFLKVWTKLFREADFNNDKQVSKEEFLRYYDEVSTNDALYFRCIKPFFDALFKAIDIDEDGLFSKEEFKAFYRAWGNADEDAEKAFQKLDTNKDGSISHLELYTMFYSFFMSNKKNDKSQLFFGPLE